MSDHAPRRTWRKQRIEKLLATTFAGEAILLDELRWAVMPAAIEAERCDGGAVTRSWMNSFARTIREQFPDCTIQKIPINERTPVGIVVRAAVYRLADPATLRRFLGSLDACILCRFRTD